MKREKSGEQVGHWCAAHGNIMIGTHGVDSITGLIVL